MGHQILEPAYRLSFWTDTSACDECDPWTRCKIGPRGGDGWDGLEFDRTAEGRRMLDKVSRLMRDAYERGKMDAKTEIRRTLGLD